MAVSPIGVGSSAQSIGQLRRTAILLVNTPTANSSGGEADNYTTVLTTRCSLTKMSGGYALLQGALTTERSYKMICRYQTAIVITADSRWQIGSDTYRISDQTLMEDKPHFYQFILQKL